MSEGEAKVCVICKQDCSGRPHVKDRQGRYACRACVEKQQARVAAKTPPQRQSDGLDPVMARLVEGSVAVKSTPCPQCSNPIPTGGIVCIQCGFNTETGKSMRTRVTVEEPAKKKGKKG